MLVRPLLMEYLQRYNREQAKRHDVPPGITGWAQVNGRNRLTWDDKFDLDLAYVKHASFLLDLRILLVTPLRVLTGRNVSHPGHATMSEFKPVDQAQSDAAMAGPRT